MPAVKCMIREVDVDVHLFFIPGRLVWKSKDSGVNIEHMDQKAMLNLCIMTNERWNIRKVLTLQTNWFSLYT